VKAFWIYTAMRLGLFLGAFAIVFGIWFLIADEVPVFWAMVAAFIISGVASYFFLDRQRAALAVNVEQRAGRITEKYEEYKAKEDD
jgi:hypothetical protein